MLNVSRLIIFVLFSLNISMTAYGARIVVYVECAESTTEYKGTKPIVKLLTTGKSLQQEDSPEGWIFQVKIGDELVTPLLIDLEGIIPTNLSFDALRLEAPFTAVKSTFLIKLAAVQRTGSAKTARSLFATNVNTIDQVNLPVFYQQARAEALERMKNLNREWNNLHDYDVQVVFKYLEVVREINKKTYIVPPKDINNAKEWLKQAIDNKSRRVDKAVKLKQATTLIEETEKMEAIRFNKLWNFIKGMDLKDRYPFLLAYKEMLSNIPSGERKEKILKETQVPDATILSSIAESLSFIIRCLPRNTIKDAEGVLTSLIEELKLENKISYIEDKKIKEKLRSDIECLQNLKNTLEKGLPLFCPEQP